MSQNPYFTVSAPNTWNPARGGSTTWMVEGANGTVQFALDGNSLPGNSGGTVTSKDGSLTMTRGDDWKTTVVITSTGTDGMGVVTAKAGNATISGTVFVGTLLVIAPDGDVYQAPSQLWEYTDHDPPEGAESYAMTVQSVSGQTNFFLSRNQIPSPETNPTVYAVTPTSGTGTPPTPMPSTIFVFPPNDKGTTYSPPTENLYCFPGSALQGPLSPSAPDASPLASDVASESSAGGMGWFSDSENIVVNVACFVLNLGLIPYEAGATTNMEVSAVQTPGE